MKLEEFLLMTFVSIFQILSRRYIAHNCENMKDFKCPLKGFQFPSWLRSFHKRISIALSRIFVEVTWGFIGNPASSSGRFRKFPSPSACSLGLGKFPKSPSDSGDFLLKYDGSLNSFQIIHLFCN